MHEPTPAPILFLDFDGTISRADVVDLILERHADPRWMLVEEEWRAGRIGSRECLARQMALVDASGPAMDTLTGTVDIDPGFVQLLEIAVSRYLPVHIISDGFDYCIERILDRLPARLRRSVGRVCASHLQPAGDGLWQVSFPFAASDCLHGCATCKPAAMRALNPSGRPALFAGDGLSDRYAAQAADMVFAKGSLASWCTEQAIAHTCFTTLAEVAAALDLELADGLAWRLANAARARA
jgi:2,3-diketo-5-methylthio-1-phosphopentane phosphatase